MNTHLKGSGKYIDFSWRLGTYVNSFREFSAKKLWYHPYSHNATLTTPQSNKNATSLIQKVLKRSKREKDILYVVSCFKKYIYSYI